MHDPTKRAHDAPVGSEFTDSGYFTQAFWLRSRSSLELEDRLGFRRGRMAGGWTLLFMKQLPTPSDYEMRGMSYMSDGKIKGHLPENKSAPFAEQRLAADGMDTMSMKANQISQLFTLKGPHRLARVVPILPPFGDDDYPPGSGIPQWRLVRPLPFIVAQQLKPGEPYLGHFT